MKRKIFPLFATLELSCRCVSSRPPFVRSHSFMDLLPSRSRVLYSASSVRLTIPVVHTCSLEQSSETLVALGAVEWGDRDRVTDQGGRDQGVPGEPAGQRPGLSEEAMGPPSAVPTVLRPSSPFVWLPITQLLAPCRPRTVTEHKAGWRHLGNNE